MDIENVNESGADLLFLEKRIRLGRGLCRVLAKLDFPAGATMNFRSDDQKLVINGDTHFLHFDLTIADELTLVTVSRDRFTKAQEALSRINWWEIPACKSCGG